ncbi:pyridine nucleotide-disulfide oxidoreductase domain-containing protein 2-like [Mizuhopecten yessoensis]|uniref:Pyridine nucleotide-disulfide oxidoreductase domain-containing protein 2 n=1 Tax=Mizuhopecten yessoensis TaxID=6573 RepID=A0A210PUR2_MIZYE|nr:pyridine nucleotide-disulfide oxidoreductase domain-containing protein 2-like [Mizuhopecten yessoensis]OWF40195.1 Pyridine nucleotide-disulfide oxidoreductase domain-containing protein 2 [Mizuhopecten yessoensis]
MAFRGRLKGICGTIKSCRLPNCKYSTTTFTAKNELKSRYDVVIVGAGHNGLVSAAYLQEAGLSVCVVERRHVIGGAAVTEEIIPGFKFSRASYVLSLLRPNIVQDLELKKYGLEVYLRDPSSYTPLLTPGGRDGKARSLLLHRDSKKTAESIAQFSEKDAKSWFEYEEQLEHIVAAIEPLMDSAPIHLPSITATKLREQLKSLPAIFTLLKTFKSLGSFKETDAFYELMTAPTTKILDKWFESEPLKATLATDSVIGAMISPKTPGSGYVLLHHVMGELEGVKGAWGIVKGGMGAVSQAIANCAVDRGASIFTDSPVQEIVTNNNSVKGVVLQDGTAIEAKAVLSNATPKVTFLDLLPEGNLPEDMMKELRNFDYTSPVTKINVALKELPNFVADPNTRKNEVMPHHRATIHLNCEHSDLIHDGFLEAQEGKFSSKPMIEMVLPTSLDPTVAPPGCHVCLLFTQYTPYHLAGGQEWDDQSRNKYADTVFDDIEKYAPGFKASVVGRDILTPPDLEKTFNLTGGNIFHGTMGLDQLYMSRPISRLSNYRSPVRGLYLCGSGAHPGGGVMGSAGRLAAITALSDFKKL